MTFARIGIFETDGQAFEPVVDLFRDRITPMFEAIDGFLGDQAFVEDGGRCHVGISYWTSLNALESSADLALFAGDEAAKLGARVADAPMTVRLQFDTRTP